MLHFFEGAPSHASRSWCARQISRGQQQKERVYLLQLQHLNYTGRAAGGPLERSSVPSEIGCDASNFSAHRKPCGLPGRALLTKGENRHWAGCRDRSASSCALSAFLLRAYIPYYPKLHRRVWVEVKAQGLDFRVWGF